jgi:hypothetical protein
MHAGVQFNSESGQKPTGAVMWAMRVVMVFGAFVAITMKFPAVRSVRSLPASCCANDVAGRGCGGDQIMVLFWIYTALFTVLQTKFFRIEAVRKYFHVSERTERCAPLRLRRTAGCAQIPERYDASKPAIINKLPEAVVPSCVLPQLRWGSDRSNGCAG